MTGAVFTKVASSVETFKQRHAKTAAKFAEVLRDKTSNCVETFSKQASHQINLDEKPTFPNPR